MAKLMALYLEDDASADRALFDKWNVRRFREGRLLQEKMILG
jgi:hypothetical protein